MKLFGDFHTHSVFSKFHHGKNTIHENVSAAKEKGLKSYGITDHGPKHFLYGITKKNLKRARHIVDELNSIDNNIKIYLGVEANILSKTGKIDLSDEQIKLLDYIVMGYHKGTFTNFVGYLFARNTEKQIQNNTDAYINAIKKYKIAFISHPNCYIKVDTLRLAKACEETNTLIEINNRHFKFTDEEMKEMIQKTNVKFIVSSDAHRAIRIGEVGNAIDMVKKHNIPLDRVVNINNEYIPKACN